MSKTTLAIEFASNLFGSLPVESKERIKRYLNKPTHKNWDDIYCLIISDGSSRKLSTIWQAVVAIDPSFPQSAGCNTSCKDLKKKWPTIPSAETVIHAMWMQIVKNDICSN